MPGIFFFFGDTRGFPGCILVVIQVYLIPRPGQDVYTRAETPFRLKPRTDIRFQNNAAEKLQVTQQRFKDNLNLGGGASFALVWWKEFSRFPIVTSPAGPQSLCNVYSQVKTIRGSDAVLPRVPHPPSLQRAGRQVLCGSYITTGSGK